jgi:hypothetical protein
MMVRVLEIACVTTPKGFLCWLDDNGACTFCLGHNGIDFISGRNVVTDSEFGWVWNPYRNSRIQSETLARPNCEFQAGL